MINLTSREKRLLKILGGCAAPFAAYFLLILPLLELKKFVDPDYSVYLKKKARLDAIYQKFSEIDAKKRTFDAHIKNSRSLTSVIEENAIKSGIIKNKVDLTEILGTVKGNYKKISARARFEGVEIKSLLEFLHEMENANSLVVITELKIKPAYKVRNVYDFTINFESITQQ